MTEIPPPEQAVGNPGTGTAEDAPSWQGLVAEFLQSWPQVFLLLLGGAILGYFGAPWLPLRHRAEVPMVVRIDYASTQYLPPELIYIQTERLQITLEHPQVLQQVLTQLPPALRSQYTSPEDLARHFKVDWRITDQWFLVAYANEEDHARILAETWAGVIKERLPQWESTTQEYLSWKLIENLTLWERIQQERQRAGAQRAQEVLQAWLERNRTRPLEEPLPEAERQTLLFWAAFAQIPNDTDILGMAPPSGAPRKAYMNWIRTWVLPRLPGVIAWTEIMIEERLPEMVERARERRRLLEQETLMLWHPVDITIEDEVRVYGLPRPAMGAILGSSSALALSILILLARVAILRRKS